MDQGERERLSGNIEFDETYVGGVDPGAGGRSRGKKSPVAVVCEAISPTASSWSQQGGSGLPGCPTHRPCP